MCDFDGDCGEDMDVECDVDTDVETDSDIGEEIDSDFEGDLGMEVDDGVDDAFEAEINDGFEDDLAEGETYFENDIDTSFVMDLGTEDTETDSADEIDNLELPEELQTGELPERLELESAEQIEESEPELTITGEILDEFIKETEDTDTLNSLRYAVESGRLQVDTEELPEETDATEPELSVPEEMLDEVVSKTEDTDVLHSLRDAVESGRLQVDTEELSEEMDTTAPELSVPEEVLDEVISETEDADALNNLRDALEAGNLEVETQELEEDISGEVEEEDVSEELETGEEDVPAESGIEENLSEGLEMEEDVPEEFEEEEDIPEELEEEENKEELKTEDIMRDVLQENVTEQKLPSSRRVEWLDEGTPGESDCRLREDSELKIHDKASNSDIAYTGKEFSEHMKEKYGTDIVNYHHREPDFTPFEHEFTNERINDFMQQKYGTEWENIKAVSEGNVQLEHMDTKRNGGTFSQASGIVAERLGISREDVDDYMKANNLTWHECGDRHTVRAIPSEINQAFGYTGGIGLQQDMEAMAENIHRMNGDDITLKRDFLTGDTENLGEAISGTQERNRAIKKELFK